MVYEHCDYRAYLRAELSSRIGRNPQFSLRAFAQLLGVNHAMLSQVIKGQRNFSQDRAWEVAAKLKLGKRESEFFCLLVQRELTKSASGKTAIETQLARLRPPQAHTPNLSVDAFRALAEWYHLPILVLAQLERPHVPGFFAETLGISVAQATQALERLERLGLLVRVSADRYETSQRQLVAAQGDDDGLKQYHQEMMKKALVAIENQPAAQRVTGSETLLLPVGHLPELRRLTYEFLDRAVGMGRSGGDLAETAGLYHVQVNCFRLDQEKPA